MKPIHRLLADDHTLVRAGIRKLLESMAEIEVVGEPRNGLAVIEMAEQLKPKLVLMDIAMPGLNGLEATARLVKAQPSVLVVILSMHQADEYVRQALRHGASGRLGALRDARGTYLHQQLSCLRWQLAINRRPSGVFLP